MWSLIVEIRITFYRERWGFRLKVLEGRKKETEVVIESGF